MIDLRNVPISREKIQLVEKLLSSAKNEFNAGRANFENREKKLWEASNEQYNAKNAAMYSDKYQELSASSLIYSKLLDKLDKTYFPEGFDRDTTINAVALIGKENSIKLGCVSKMIEIGSYVRGTSFNPDAFVSLFDVVPDDYMRLAEGVSDCLDTQELRYQKLQAEVQERGLSGEYLQTLQNAMVELIDKHYGTNSSEKFGYNTELSADFINEVMTKTKELSKETDNVM